MHKKENNNMGWIAGAIIGSLSLLAGGAYHLSGNIKDVDIKVDKKFELVASNQTDFIDRLSATEANQKSMNEWLTRVEKKLDIALQKK